MTTKQETAEDRLAREEREMDEKIRQLEDEQRELEAPANLPSWDAIQNGQDLGERERRRGLLPRLIVAAKVKRLELRHARHEGEIESLQERRDKAHVRLQKARAKRIEAQDEENAAAFEYGDAQSRIASREMHVKSITREIRELQG